LRNQAQRSRRQRHLAFGLLWLGSCVTAGAAVCTFAVDDPFSIGAATTSSRLAVSGVGGAVSRAAVALTDVGAPGGEAGGISDIDLLLVGPAGQKIVLLSYVCPAEYQLLDLDFDKGASEMLPSGDPESPDCASGTYLPSDYSAPFYLLGPPAPPGPYSTDLATLEGVDPTGMWTLWGESFSSANEAQVASWELRLTADACGAPTLVFADDFESGGCGWSDATGESPACP
jgi:hypothetical protein